MPHHFALAQGFANGNATGFIGCDDVEHTCWNTCAHGQFARSQSRQRREFSRFDDDGAARSQSRSHFAGDHGQRKVPGRDGGAHANGLFDDHQAAVVVPLGQGFAMHSLGFFGVPLHKARTVDNFASAFYKGLALLCSQDAAQVVLVGNEQIKPLAQNDAAFFAGFGAPSRPSGVGSGNSGLSFGGAKVGHIGQLDAQRRVVHIKPLAAWHPLSVDERIGFQQAGFFKQT